MMAATASSYLPAMNPSHHYNPQAGPSPPEGHGYGKPTFGANMSQTPPSNNVSPTNVFSNVNPRQLRQPRQPLYTPAALRPTDHIARPTDIPGRPRAPDTPPASKDSSFDSGRVKSPQEADFASGILGNATSSDDFASLRRGLSRAASETLEEDFGEVTGVPTTAHWKPDASASACFICNAVFTWWFRRHHCRRCGNLVCDAHIKHSVPLDQNARYNPNGTMSKACKVCWDDWKIVKKLHHYRSGSIAESSNSSQGTAVPIPASKPTSNDMRIGSMARSEGMVWSTF